MGKAENEVAPITLDQVTSRNGISSNPINMRITRCLHDLGLRSYKEVDAFSNIWRYRQDSATTLEECINKVEEKFKERGEETKFSLPTAFRTPARHVHVQDIEHAQIIMSLCNLPGRPFTAKDVGELLDKKNKELSDLIDNLALGSPDFKGAKIRQTGYGEHRFKDIPSADEIVFELIKEGVVVDVEDERDLMKDLTSSSELICNYGYSSVRLEDKYAFGALINWGPIAKGREVSPLNRKVLEGFMHFAYHSISKSGRFDKPFLDTLSKEYNKFLIEYDLAFLGSLQRRVHAYANGKQKPVLDFELPKLPNPAQMPIYAYINNGGNNMEESNG